MPTAPTSDRFEDRLLASILEDFDHLRAVDETGETSEAAPRPGRSRLARRPVAIAVGVAAAAALAVGGVAAVGSHQGKPAPSATQTPTSAQALTYRLASVSAVAPVAAGRYVELSETDTDSSQPGQTQRTTVIDTQTGQSVTYQQGVAGSSIPAVLNEGPDPTSTGAWYTALPTDPVALRAQLLALAQQQAAAAATTEAQQAAAAGKNIAAGQPQLSDDDLVYEEANTMLWRPLPQPGLRSALYKVLAATGGYTVSTNATDPGGRAAVAMTRSSSTTGVTEVTYEDPTTGAVLAQSWEQVSSAGTDTSTAVYQAVTSSDSIPADPYTT